MKVKDTSVSIDDLARERLSSQLNDTINKLKLYLVLQYKDEHIAIKADKYGVHLNSKVRFRGLGTVLMVVGGSVLLFINSI